MSEKISFVCRYGLLAPSVHNTQPWHFSIKDNLLSVFVNPDEILEYGDPIHRELWISMGALLENLCLAADHFGLLAKKITYDYDISDKPNIVISFQKTTKTSKSDYQKLFEAIPHRFSDRTLYSQSKLDSKIIKKLQAIHTPQGVKSYVVEDRAIIEQIAQLTANGITLALSTPNFRQELSELIHHNLTSKASGMPGFVLGENTLRSFYASRKIKQNSIAIAQGKQEYKAMTSASAMLVVAS